MSSTRVTIRDLAREAKVAVSTVSKALRSDPRISSQQCQRIQAIAKRLGYRPDPEVSKLMSHLHHSRRRADPHAIAWIDFWADVPEAFLGFDMSQELEGAKRRAQELGYDIEVYKATPEDLAGDRLLRVLTARSQWGIIFPPMPDYAMRLPWDLRGFAAVTIGTSLHEPSLHRVSHTHFRGSTLAFEQMRKRGAVRIGLALSEAINRRVDGKWLGGFHAASHWVPSGERVAPLICEAGDHQAVHQWLEKEKPDAVLIAEKWISAPLRNSPSGHQPTPVFLAFFPGVESELRLDYQPERIGSTAVEMVVAQIHRNERGSPTCPQTVLLDPVWVGGSQSAGAQTAAA